MKLSAALKYCLIVMALISQFTADAQSNPIHLPSDTAYNTFSMRAKMIPSFLLLPGMHYSLGGEYGFLKRHGIGIDFAYNELQAKQLGSDSIVKAGGQVPYTQAVDRSILVSYRYYSKNWLATKFGTYRPYVSGFVRAGRIDYHYDEGYETTQIKYDEQQLSTGILFGTMRSLEISGLCLDVNIGPFWKWKTIQDVHYDNKVVVHDNLLKQNLGLRVGFTLMYVFQRERTRY